MFGNKGNNQIDSIANLGSNISEDNRDDVKSRIAEDQYVHSALEKKEKRKGLGTTSVIQD
jgi:hypothetical protein